MIAPVTALLLVADIILDLRHADVRPPGDYIGDFINVLDKLADDTHTGDILHLIFHSIKGNVLLLHLVQNTGNAFHTSQDLLDRTVNSLLMILIL